MFKSINQITLGTLILMYFSCTPQNSQVIVKKTNCYLLEENIEILPEGYKEFNSDLEDFISSQKEYDLLHIFIKAGNHLESYSKRWSCDKEIWTGFEHKENTKNKITVNVHHNDLNDMLINITEGSYFKICEYSSDQNTHLFLIRKSGKVIFKYIYCSYGDLSKSDMEKIYLLEKIFSELEKCSSPTPQ